MKSKYEKDAKAFARKLRKGDVVYSLVRCQHPAGGRDIGADMHLVAEHRVTGVDRVVSGLPMIGHRTVDAVYIAEGPLYTSRDASPIRGLQTFAEHTKDSYLAEEQMLASGHLAHQAAEGTGFIVRD